jgi:hypothetical protein
MKRLQFDMPENKVKELDELVEQIGLKTRTQLINSALSLFKWAVRQREEGRIIASLDEVTGQYKEIEMPGFPAVAEKRALGKKSSPLQIDTGPIPSAQSEIAFIILKLLEKTIREMGKTISDDHLEDFYKYLEHREKINFVLKAKGVEESGKFGFTVESEESQEVVRPITIFVGGRSKNKKTEFDQGQGANVYPNPQETSDTDGKS